MANIIKSFNISHMKAPCQNVFDIVRPDLYHCRVTKYEQGHSVMYIALRTQEIGFDPHFYLMFEDVQYFEGPMMWEGANFCTASLEEYGVYLEKIQQREKVVDSQTSLLLDFQMPIPGRLFVVNTPNLQIKLISSIVSLTDSLE